MACRCSSLLFPTTSLFPPRQRGVVYSLRVYCSRLLFIECRCSIQPFKSIVRASTRLLFASSIHRVQVFHSAVQIYCSRVDASIVRVFYCSRLLLCVLKLITGSKTSINGRRFLIE